MLQHGRAAPRVEVATGACPGLFPKDGKCDTRRIARRHFHGVRSLDGRSLLSRPSARSVRFARGAASWRAVQRGSARARRARRPAPRAAARYSHFAIDERACCSVVVGSPEPRPAHPRAAAGQLGFGPVCRRLEFAAAGSLRAHLALPSRSSALFNCMRATVDGVGVEPAARGLAKPGGSSAGEAGGENAAPSAGALRRWLATSTVWLWCAPRGLSGRRIPDKCPVLCRGACAAYSSPRLCALRREHQRGRARLPPASSIGVRLNQAWAAPPAALWAPCRAGVATLLSLLALDTVWPTDSRLWRLELSPVVPLAHLVCGLAYGCNLIISVLRLCASPSPSLACAPHHFRPLPVRRPQCAGHASAAPQRALVHGSAGGRASYLCCTP